MISKLVTHETDYTWMKSVNHILLNIARKGWEDQEATHLRDPLNLHEEYETLRIRVVLSWPLSSDTPVASCTLCLRNVDNIHRCLPGRWANHSYWSRDLPCVSLTEETVGVRHLQAELSCLNFISHLHTSPSVGKADEAQTETMSEPCVTEDQVVLSLRSTCTLSEVCFPTLYALSF